MTKKFFWDPSPDAFADTGHYVTVNCKGKELAQIVEWVVGRLGKINQDVWQWFPDVSTSFHHMVFCFQDPKEAVLFKLMWGGK